MAGLNQFRSLALVFLLAGTTTTSGLHAERGACDADGVDCKDGDTHKDGGAMEGGVDGVQESDVYKQCARLLVGGDAAAAANCFAKVPASDTSWCAEDERTVLVVQMTDVGATKRVDRKMVRCSNPSQAACTQRSDGACVWFPPVVVVAVAVHSSLSPPVLHEHAHAMKGIHNNKMRFKLLHLHLDSVGKTHSRPHTP